jgi:glycosyltransferase involved in cell wall biosynthesis
VHIALCHHLSLGYCGGGEKWIINVAKELAHRGHDVEVFALPFMLEGKSKKDPKEMLEDIPYTEAMRHKIKADVVYITYNPLNWLNFKSSKPRIAGIHAQSYWTKINPRYGFKPNLANMVHKINGNFELSRFNAVHMVTQAYQINHPKVYYIPNFVDSQKYKPIKKKDETFTIVYSNRMVWQKGWGIFKTVTKHLEKSGTNFKIKITAEKIKEPDMPTFLSEAHLALLPSEVDTFGLAIVESLLCETPVITTPLITHKTLELPLIYGDSVTQYIKNVHRFSQLWTKDKTKYFELANYCRQQALRYDKEKIMDQIENMFREVCNEI